MSKLTRVVRSHGKLIVVDEITPDVPPGKPRPWKRQFVMVPWAWVERLRKAKQVSTWRLVHPLLYECWLNGGQPMVLSNIKAREAGLSRSAKHDALLELQKLDLITIERQVRKSPRVILKHLERG